MALRFFQTFQRSSLVHFIQTCLTFGKNSYCNLSYLSLLAHQEVGPNRFIADLQAVTNVCDMLDKFSAAIPQTVHTLITF